MPIARLDQHLRKTADKLNAGQNKKLLNHNNAIQTLLLEKAISITGQLVAVKLDYLTPYRPVPSLSGGEMQRLF